MKFPKGSQRRDKFFSIVRNSVFGGGLIQLQVEALDALLDAWDATDYTDLRWLASTMGQVRLECGANMYPVREGFKDTDEASIAYVTRMYNAKQIKRNYAIPEPGSILAAFGRGMIQLTWLENYVKAGKKLGLDLVNEPELLLAPAASAKVALVGCAEGWFRGDKQGRKKLSRYFNNTTEDWDGARDIVNGDTSTKGRQLEEASRRFYQALMLASKESASTSEINTEGMSIMGMIFSKLAGSFARHMLTIVGGMLVSNGIIDSGSAAELTAGFGAIIAGLLGSIGDKIGKK